MANPRRKMIELFKDIDKDLNGKIELLYYAQRFYTSK